MPKEPDLGLLQAAELLPDLETDTLYDDEKQSHENARLRLENLLLEAKIDDVVQDRDQRKKYSDRLFKLVVGWLCAIGVIILLHGFSCIPFNLSVAVLSTIIGSTTASVLGLFVIVANYLFPPRGEKGSL